MTEQERITKLRAALEEIRAFTDDLTIAAIIQKALGVNESMKFSVSQREPAEVMLENSQRRCKELREQLDAAMCAVEKLARENGRLEVQVATLSVNQDRVKKLEVVASAAEKLINSKFTMSNCNIFTSLETDLMQALTDLKFGGYIKITSLDELENGPWPTFVKQAKKNGLDSLKD